MRRPWQRSGSLQVLIAPRDWWPRTTDAQSQSSADRGSSVRWRLRGNLPPLPRQPRSSTGGGATCERPCRVRLCRTCAGAASRFRASCGGCCARARCLFSSALPLLRVPMTAQGMGGAETTAGATALATGSRETAQCVSSAVAVVAAFQACSLARNPVRTRLPVPCCRTMSPRYGLVRCDPAGRHGPRPCRVLQPRDLRLLNWQVRV